MALTEKKIGSKPYKEPGRYGDGHGLYLQVISPTNRSWLLRYQTNGRKRWMGLGPLHTFTLKQARERAREARQKLADGVDPLDHRKAEQAKQAAAAMKALTFEEAAQQYFNFHEKKWSNDKHRKQFMSTLRAYAFPMIGRLPVSEIDTGLVLKVIEPIWQEKTETANRTRGRIEAVLDWATVRGYRTGENPARWKGHLAEVLPARSQLAPHVHHRALPFTEMPEFWAQLAAREGMAAQAFRFLILTAARTNEVIGACWSEFDLKHGVWTVPASRMKSRREHRVPLSSAALEILRALPREGEFVFPGTQQGSALSNMVLYAVLQRMGRSDLSVHGCRSSFRDWAAERTGYPNHVVEMALAHAIGDKVERAYRRGDLFAKRARLMADWAKFCTTKPAAKSDTASNVSSIRGRA